MVGLGANLTNAPYPTTREESFPWRGVFDMIFKLKSFALLAVELTGIMVRKGDV